MRLRLMELGNGNGSEKGENGFLVFNSGLELKKAIASLESRSEKE